VLRYGLRSLLDPISALAESRLIVRLGIAQNRAGIEYCATLRRSAWL
jgi:hypothetical protein